MRYGDFLRTNYRKKPFINPGKKPLGPALHGDPTGDRISISLNGQELKKYLSLTFM
jgi:hypothetical protein